MNRVLVTAEHHVSLVCPDCRGQLLLKEDECICSRCRRSFLTLLGVPDLRIATDTWIDYGADLDLARSLVAQFADATSAELVGRVWESRAAIPEDLLKRRIREIAQAQSNYLAELSPGGWIGQLLDQHEVRTCLEVGSGTGAFLGAVSRHALRVVGVDVSMSWLVVARKRLEEQGISCQLVCACVEQLPFEDAAFDLAVSLDVLEHVSDRDRMVQELRRTSRTGGLVICSTPNRFSLSPEPHVGLFGVGYLPRHLMQKYVSCRRGMSYEHTYPLSRRDLRGLFQRGFTCSIRLPRLREADIETFSRPKKLAAKLYNGAIGFRVFRLIVAPIAPFFHVIAIKFG